MPAEAASNEHDDSIEGYSEIHQASEDGNRNVVDIFSIHSGNRAGAFLESLIVVIFAQKENYMPIF